MEVVKARIQQGRGKKKKGNARGKMFEVLRKKTHNLDILQQSAPPQKQTEQFCYQSKHLGLPACVQ